MKQIFARFIQKDSGAVTVDWVVITAIGVGLAVLALSTVELATADTVGDTVTVISAQDAVGPEIPMGAGS